MKGSGVTSRAGLNDSRRAVLRVQVCAGKRSWIMWLGCGAGADSRDLLYTLRYALETVDAGYVPRMNFRGPHPRRSVDWLAIRARLIALEYEFSTLLCTICHSQIGQMPDLYIDMDGVDGTGAAV